MYVYTVELIHIELDIKPTAHIICIYVPPSCSDSYHREVTRYFNSVSLTTNTFILGDFNVPDVNWHTLNASQPFSQMLCDFACSKNFVQLITSSTHRRGNTLDLIFTNSPHRVNNINISQPSIPTDHYLVSADILMAIASRSHSTDQDVFHYSYLRTDFESMGNFLEHAAEYYCNVVATTTDVDFSWSHFKLMIESACNQFVPKVRKRNKMQPQWFNSSIRQDLNRIHTYRRRYCLKPSSTNLSNLQNAEHELETKIRFAKDDYLQNLVCIFQSQPRKLYHHLKSLSHSKFKPNFFTQGNDTLYNPMEIAEAFNDFFHSTFNRPNHRQPLSDITQLSPPSQQLSEIVITRSDIYEVLSKLDTTKARGSDNIHPLVLKNCSISLLDCTYHLYVHI